MILVYCVNLLVTVRNKDNTWPEEMITLVKELKAKEKRKQSLTTHSTAVAIGQCIENFGINSCKVVVTSLLYYDACSFLDP